MVGIRVDANEYIASGHIMRCLSIADALLELGEDGIYRSAVGSRIISIFHWAETEKAFHKLLKRSFAFAFVTIAWIFFRTGTKDALMYIKEMLTTTGIVKAVNGGLLTIGLSTGDLALLSFSLLLTYIVDRIQYNRGLRVDALVV